jgi:hypothetical protein
MISRARAYVCQGEAGLASEPRGAAAESRDLVLVPYTGEPGSGLVPYTGGTRSPHACFPSLTSNYARHASNSLIWLSTTSIGQVAEDREIDIVVR